MNKKTQRIIVIVLAAVLLLSLLASALAAIAYADVTKQDIQNIKDDLSDIQAQKKEVQARLAEIRDDLSQAEAQVELIQSQVVLTEEDSGEEDTLSICREIAAHVACECRIEPNRGEAIRQAVLSCRVPSLLLITGKGAETRQKRGLAYIDTPSDVEYVRAFLREWDVKRGLRSL